jgi:2-polyprenyl-3-methyl-5-hydroxy-6-metoxy-1,4-benzoquinol methylase
LGKTQLGISIFCGEISDLTISEKYDLIIAIAVIEHTVKPIDFLTLVEEKLAPDGKVIILVPNFGGLWRYLMGTRWIWYMPPYHLHHFTVKSFGNMVKLAGLRTDNVFTNNTGTYLYLLHKMLFNKSDQLTSGQTNTRKFVLVMVLERILRIVLYPILLVIRLLKLDAHIIGILSHEK